MNIEAILEQVIFKCKNHKVSEVILFGSWVKGTANERSDIDLAVTGVKDIEKLREDIEDIPTLRSFDVVDMEHCKNELLLKEIAQYGRTL